MMKSAKFAYKLAIAAPSSIWTSTIAAVISYLASNHPLIYTRHSSWS